jgi:hypothetical protein
MNVKKGSMLSAMLVLTVYNHKGQFDKGGKPYILHPLRIMHRLRTDDECLQCIALGLAVVEDCGVTYQQLADIGMPMRVIDGIRALTKVPGETYEEYKAKVMRNWDAMLVKMEDLRENSDIRRLKGITPKDVERMQRYQAFWLELKNTIAEGRILHDGQYSNLDSQKDITYRQPGEACPRKETLPS